MYERVSESVVLVGGSGFSRGDDCLVYALDLGDLVLVDCGAGPGWPSIRQNILEAGLEPSKIHTLLLTHCHVDHIGAVSEIVNETGCRVVAHALDSDAIESGDPRRTASTWYGVDLPRVEVTRRVAGDRETLKFQQGELELIHTPGHTPGSLAALLVDGDERVLFGQDIHGPFIEDFGSDIPAWRHSMETLLALEATVLCEGHFGVYRSRAEVRKFIEGHLANH